MAYENINYNEVLISGVINNICEKDLNNKYIKFSIVSKRFTSKEDNVYISLNIKHDLYNIYKDFFYVGNKVYIKGYLNSYFDKSKNNNIFITVTNISNNPNNINGSSSPHIRYDSDGVMVWNGKRCESVEASIEEQQELQNLINNIINVE